MGKFGTQALQRFWPDDMVKRRLMNRSKKIFLAVFRMALFIGLIYVIIYPMLYMLSTTFRTDADILDPSVVWIPKHFTLTNLQQAFVSMKYLNSLWNTVSIMMVSALLQVGVTAVVGYGFARFKFRFKKLLFALVLFTIVVPAQTTIIPVFVGFSNFDVLGIVKLINALTGADIILRLTNTPLVMYLPALFGMGIRSGLFIYIFRQFFRNMPKELEEAAMIDGCGPFRSFIRVMVPNAGSVFLTATILSMVWYWNDYYLSTMLMDKVMTITVALSRLQEALWNFVSANEMQLMLIRMQAGCLLAILPPLIAYFFVQNKFTESVERSGIVG